MKKSNNTKGAFVEAIDEIDKRANELVNEYGYNFDNYRGTKRNIETVLQKPYQNFNQTALNEQKE